MKSRLDKFLVENSLVESREKAIELIKAGFVEVNGKTVKKPSFKVSSEDDVKVKQKFPYVSRAGLKLERALKVFNLSPSGKVCLDVGSSTGGFTDCLLQNGAERVYAVDVGTDQLHPSLRNNPKVILMENTNARYLTKEQIPEEIQFLTCDVSFISVLKILPSIKSLLSKDFKGVILIKPQFELSKEKLKKGVVKKKEYHIEAIKKVIEGLRESGYKVEDLTYSTPFGTDGNIEFLAFVSFLEHKVNDDKIKQVVEQAHLLKQEEQNGSSGLS